MKSQKDEDDPFKPRKTSSIAAVISEARKTIQSPSPQRTPSANSNSNSPIGARKKPASLKDPTRPQTHQIRSLTSNVSSIVPPTPIISSPSTNMLSPERKMEDEETTWSAIHNELAQNDPDATGATASSLTKAIKELYKRSKSDGNDIKFREEKIIEQLLRHTQAKLEKESMERILFSVATLKNITMNNEENQTELGFLGAVQQISAFLSKSKLNEIEGIIKQPESDNNNPTTTRPRSSSVTKKNDSSLFLLQVIGLLRNLANNPDNRKYFAGAPILNLIEILAEEPSSGQSQKNDIVFHVTRIFSKLTLYSDCKNLLIEHEEFLKYMLQALLKYQQHHGLVIRVCFILGNMTGSLEAARLALVQKFDALPGLVDIFSKNLEKDKDIRQQIMQEQQNDIQSQDKDPYLAKSDVEEQLIKMIRLLANLAISPQIGPTISQLPVLKSLVDLLESKNMEESEELILNVIGFITNLSYYSNEPNNYILIHQEEITDLLIPHLSNTNEEFAIETARALGNFSRNAQVRHKMSETKADEYLVFLLDHSNRELVYNVCGVLMNFMADTSSKHILMQVSDGMNKLIEVLKESVTAGDILLCTTVLKTLYNFLLDQDCKSLDKKYVTDMLAGVKSVMEAASNGKTTSSEKEEIKDIAVKLCDLLNQPMLVPL